MALFCCVALLAPASAEAAVFWKELEPGLSLAAVPLEIIHQPLEESPSEDRTPAAASTVTATATILRIDPARFAFSLHMASESGQKTFAEIGKDENLVAATNAGMYLPDRLTSTGHLRSPTHTNNGRIAGKFGSFFVAEPVSKGLPHARLLDKHKDDWQALITQYGLVMQNYRMTTPEGRLIWKQEARPHSVAALSQDRDGNILFLFCPDPVYAGDFITALLRLPLGVTSVMYLEGGTDAALLIRAGDEDSVRAGRHSSGLWTGIGGYLPNVLGVRRRTAPDK